MLGEEGRGADVPLEQLDGGEPARQPVVRQGGCEAYVSKPISVPKFIETIKTYLGDA